MMLRDDWSFLLDDIQYLSKRLDECGDTAFNWSAGEAYTAEHTLDMDYIVARARTKELHDFKDGTQDKVIILSFVERNLVRDEAVIEIINRGVTQELQEMLAA